MPSSAREDGSGGDASGRRGGVGEGGVCGGGGGGGGGETVYILDDDAGVREALVYWVGSVGWRAEAYGTAEALMEAVGPESAGCLVLDVRLPGANGLDVHDALRARGVKLPVIVVTGHGEVPLAVRAVKAGAVDFMEKPLSDDRLLPRIEEAMRAGRAEQEARERLVAARERYARLTPREREVMGHVVQGALNKQIASDLGLSPKTVEVHRAHVMSKMKARSLAKLVRVAVELEGEREM